VSESNEQELRKELSLFKVWWILYWIYFGYIHAKDGNRNGKNVDLFFMAEKSTQMQQLHKAEWFFLHYFTLNFVWFWIWNLTNTDIEMNTFWFFCHFVKILLVHPLMDISAKKWSKKEISFSPNKKSKWISLSIWFWIETKFC